MKQTLSTFFEPASIDTYTPKPTTCLVSYPYPNDNRPYTTVSLHGVKFKALLDSGSNLTLISDTIYSKIKPRKLSPIHGSIVLRTASGEQLNVLGQIYLPFSFNGVVKVIPTLVVPKLAIDCICGMDFWRKFHIQPTIQQCAIIEPSHMESSSNQPLSAPFHL